MPWKPEPWNSLLIPSLAVPHLLFSAVCSETTSRYMLDLKCLAKGFVLKSQYPSLELLRSGGAFRWLSTVGRSWPSGDASLRAHLPLFLLSGCHEITDYNITCSHHDTMFHHRFQSNGSSCPGTGMFKFELNETVSSYLSQVCSKLDGNLTNTSPNRWNASTILEILDKIQSFLCLIFFCHQKLSHFSIQS